MFAVFGAPAENYKNVRIYPNPYKPSKGHTWVKMDYLTVNTKLQIFNIAGDLVYEKDDINIGEYVWDAKNNYGDDIVSGVYICLFSNSDDDKKVLKLAIIR
jgi:hypothetical protein